MAEDFDAPLEDFKEYVNAADKNIARYDVSHLW